MIEATRYNVLPLDDRVAERMNPDLAGRPVLIKGKTQILFGGMGRLSENSIVSVKNKSHSVTAEITVPPSGAEGVIIAQGGNIGGWTLYATGQRVHRPGQGRADCDRRSGGERRPPGLSG